MTIISLVIIKYGGNNNQCSMQYVCKNVVEVEGALALKIISTKGHT